MFLHHCFLKHLTNSLRFFLVHGRLIGQSNLLQHGIRIKPFGDGMFKILQKLVFRESCSQHVRFDHLSFFHILDANVIFTETDSGDCFFVGVFAVNDGGKSLALMGIHGVPHLANPWTSCIDDFNILQQKE